MTAISSIVQRDKLHVISDGAGYDREGVMRLVASKVSQIPSYPGVVAARGATHVTDLMAHHFALHAPTFDVLVEKVEDLFPFLLDRFKDLLGGLNDCQLFIGGWSDARQRMEFYFLPSDDLHLQKVDGEAEDVGGYNLQGAGALQLLDRGSTLPTLLNGDQELGFGAGCGFDGDVEYYARTLLELQRQRKHEACDGWNAVPTHIVGGFAQLTTVSRDGITTKILHRWPDKIGETIKPAPVDWARWRATRGGTVAALAATVTPLHAGLSRRERRAMEAKARKRS